MAAFLRIFEFFMNLATGQNGLLAKSQFLTKQVVNNIRQMVIILMISFGSLALFCIGISIALSNYVEQLDKNHFFEWTYTFSGGLILSVTTLIALIICLNERTWMKVMSLEPKKVAPLASSQAGPSPIEEAVSLLIIDFVKERQQNRQQPSPPQNEN